ncbi:hypothetical protein D3Z39_15525 [Anaerotruncus colihominis]|uniref:Uncharacterized protein n=1 Tax=Anaerotruncus colihominis TaxID=169435 RepID=A0A845RJQ8_9FIRM|nr:hypothetical protein [Anaerotruncus colihominis]
MPGPVPLFAAQPTKVFWHTFFQKSMKFFAEALFQKGRKADACKIHASRTASVMGFAGGNGCI